MKNVFGILSLLITSLSVGAQIRFKTIVPPQQVVVGESFQVQYIIEDAGKLADFKPPTFSNFRFVAGPNTYQGSAVTLDGIKPLINHVYTLAAIKPGRFLIPGATAVNNGVVIRSNDGYVEIISKQEAINLFNREASTGNSDYFLRPGEDPEEKIRKNLFLKVQVDKKTCVVGQPIVATFKLYSRLESRSDIVKNPGFYGFTVYDMVNLSDNFAVSEKYQGRIFDVHTIRKVQLYPLQAGNFTIDAMEVKNQVEFSRSSVNKQTEQEIVEGVMGFQDEELNTAGTELFESAMRTEPVSITVLPLPAATRPADYNGAVGHFTISTRIIDDKISLNEQGLLEVTVKGDGNFIQLNAPRINWPTGLEGFDPVVNDLLDKTKVPLTGKRVFRYPFSGSRQGDFMIPSIGFSFFDPDSGGFRTVSSSEAAVHISPAQNQPRTEMAKTPAKKGSMSVWIFLTLGVLLLAVAILIVYRKRSSLNERLHRIPAIETPVSVDEFLKPAYINIQNEDRIFYSSLQNAVWEFLKQTGFTHAGTNKFALYSLMEKKGIDSKLIIELREFLETIESGMYTGADLGLDKKQVYNQARSLLERLL